MNLGRASPRKLEQGRSCFHNSMKDLHDISTIEELAQALDVPSGHLKYHLHIVRSSKSYRTFTIPKRDGSLRTIHAPVDGLKHIQKRLNTLFQHAYQTKPSAHGFLPKKSIVTNAEAHTRRQWVLNIDLQDFFPSIHFGRVRGMLMGIPYKLSPEVATVIAQLCCRRTEGGEHAALPQGAPSSPMITNMICARMDAQLQRLAYRSRATYTRYADDLTFSTTLKRLPPTLATTSDENSFNPTLSLELREIVEGNGFTVNERKSRLQPYFQRQEVTGLIVNDGVNTPRKYVRQIRAMIHAWQKFGLEAAEQQHNQKFGTETGKSFSNVLKGKILFLQSVRGHDDYMVSKFFRQYNDLRG
jgi:RNA-directed DNA polymerase